MVFASARRVCMILAGGKSRRMGRDKALLRLGDGVTLLERARQVASGVAGAQVVISGEEREGFEGAIFIPDRAECAGSGPLGGVASVLGEFKVSRVELTDKVFVVLPVDMPGLRANLVEALLEVLERGDADAIHYRGSVLPLVFRGTDEVLTRFFGLFSIERPASERSFKFWLSSCRSAVLDLPEIDRKALANVNTPEELNDFCLTAQVKEVAKEVAKRGE